MTSIFKRRLEKILLIAICIFGFIYSFEFGLILTAYPHGGQLLGLVFEFVLIIYSCIIIFSNSKTVRQIFRIINYSYIASMTFYVLTVKTIEYQMGDKSWEYLNVFNPPELSRNEKIFNNYAMGGLFICIALLFGRWLRNRTQNNKLISEG